jgi:hypothetical protein
MFIWAGFSCADALTTPHMSAMAAQTPHTLFRTRVIVSSSIEGEYTAPGGNLRRNPRGTNLKNF